MKNKDATRYFSNKHESQVCKILGATQTPNSGAGIWRKGDAYQEDASLLIECKTTEKDKKSFSIKKEWVEKNKEEAFMQRLDFSCVAFNFGPDQESYFVIDEKLMRFLVDKLSEEKENNGL